MVRLIAILMALTLSASPVMAVSTTACHLHACACAGMPWMAAHPSVSADTPGCCCRSTAAVPCGVRENRFPTSPPGILTADRLEVRTPAMDGPGAQAAPACAAGALRRLPSVPPTPRQARAPLIYLRHQRFLI